MPKRSGQLGSWPESIAHGVFELGQRDHVAVRPPGEQIVDRGPVYLGGSSERGDRQVERLESLSEADGEFGHLRGADWCAASKFPVGEPAADERVGGDSDGTGLSRHAASIAPNAVDVGDSLSASVSPTMTVGYNPHASDLWEDEVNAAVGSRVHRVVADLAATGEPVDSAAALAAVRRLWAADPIGGSIASSARLRCSTAVAVYFARFEPARAQWKLDGAEVRVGSAIADLVWRSERHGVVIDELKSGVADLRDPDIADQLLRLAEGGAAAFESFRGVRLVPLGSPARSVFVTAENGELVSCAAPDGMEIR